MGFTLYPSPFTRGCRTIIRHTGGKHDRNDSQTTRGRFRLLDYECTGISRDMLHLPGPDFVDRVVSNTDRTPMVMSSLQRLYDNGRLAGTGYSRCCRWTRASSTRARLPLRPTRSISTPRTSSSWQSKVAVTA